LTDLLGEDGCSGAALRILEGIVPCDLLKYSKLLFSELQKTRQPIPLNMSFEEMCNGFDRWRENTDTSPSGKQLEIYKALLNAKKNEIVTTNEQKHNISYNNSMDSKALPIAEQCLQIRFLLITLAIKHCHTYHRWTTVHNWFLEKLQGMPLINKLPAIHIYEADWSIINKYYIA
jgi:hypothetical protein